MQQLSGINLDPRLRAAAAAVRPGVVAADVGTDHGYLICYLVAAGICPRGYASDLRPQPLASAQRHIRELGLEGRIQTIQSDGLLELPGEEIDDVILAGMGGDLIGNILTAVDWTRNRRKRYVLQPMTRAPELRGFLYANGFALMDETAVVSGDFLYTVMTVAYSGMAGRISAAFAQCGMLLDKPDDLSQSYRDMVCQRLQKRADGLRRSFGGERMADDILDLIDTIRSYPRENRRMPAG